MDPIGALRINDSLGSTLSLKYLVSNTNGLKCTFEKPHLTVIQESHIIWTSQNKNTKQTMQTIQWVHNDYTLTIN